MQALAYKLFEDNKNLSFIEGDHFVWSPAEKTIRYDKNLIKDITGIWSLLHELGHANLGHQTYTDDFHLLIMEVEAWGEAKNIAKKYEVEINEAHVENCIDSYRDWLHTRSQCIDCKTVSFQENPTTYACHNCGAKWTVPASKICKVRKSRV